MEPSQEGARLETPAIAEVIVKLPENIPCLFVAEESFHTPFNEDRCPAVLLLKTGIRSSLKPCDSNDNDV